MPASRSVKQKKRPARAAKGRNTDKRDPVADAISALADTVSTERAADRKQQERSDRGKGLRETLTIVLLFVTAALVFGQFREMQKVYAPIADQAEATRESYASVQRAFVSDVRVHLDPKEIEGGKPSYWMPRITVRNSGATPTRDLRYVSVYNRSPSSPGDPEGWFEAEVSITRILKGRITIGPQSEAEVPTPVVSFRLPEAQPPEVYTQSVGTLTGAFVYGDQFTRSQLHTTKYCFVVLASSAGFVFTTPCDHWNCSDDDCKTDKGAYVARQKAP